MKKMIIFLLFLLSGCQSNTINIYDNENLIIECNGYKIITNYIIKDYSVEEKKESYTLKANTKDSTDLEINIKKGSNGYIQLKEKITINEYQYSYYLERDYYNDYKISMDGKNVYLKYNVNIKDGYYCFDGYVDIKYNKNNDYSCLDYSFYIVEDGSRRCDIKKEVYINIEK